MVASQRPAAVLLLLVAIAHTVQFIAVLFYDPMLEDAGDTVWKVIEPFDVVGLLIVILLAGRDKFRRAVDSTDNRMHFNSSVLLYFSAVLLLAYLKIWIQLRFVEPGINAPLLWDIVCSILPVLFAGVAIRILRRSPESN